MARLKAVDDANSVLTAILYAADANMHITTGSGAGQGFPTAGDWLMRIQYDKNDPAYDVTKEQWEIVRATLRPATAHPADADTIDITRVREGADAPTDWPVGSVVYNVIGQEYWTELLAELDLKAPMAQSDLITIPIIIGDGVNAITTGFKGHLMPGFAGTIMSWHIIADAAGSIVIDIWKAPYHVDTLPVDADHMPGAGKEPTLTSKAASTDADVTDWDSDDFAATDVLAFSVDSASTVKQVTLNLHVKRTYA